MHDLKNHAQILFLAAMCQLFLTNKIQRNSCSTKYKQTKKFVDFFPLLITFSSCLFIKTSTIMTLQAYFALNNDNI